jgi:hypothetical protein
MALLLGIALCGSALCGTALAGSALCGTALGAEASPLLIDPLDPRSGESANAIGSPFLAALAVVGLGALAAGATVLFVRFIRPR